MSKTYIKTWSYFFELILFNSLNQIYIVSLKLLVIVIIVILVHIVQ